MFHLKFQRIQFTPDLMPADITGTEILQEDPDGRTPAAVRAGADLRQRDPRRRDQPHAAEDAGRAAEAMQEHQVTAAGVRYPLPEPFFVLATQNPIEMEGTYPLPEAQLDRFMFNVVVDYLPEDDEVAVVQQTTRAARRGDPAAVHGRRCAALPRVVRQVPIAEDLVRYAVRLARGVAAAAEGTPDFVNEWVSWGAGTRAAQFLVLGAKARALLAGRAHVTPGDIRALARPVLRHRVLLNYRAEAEGVTVERSHRSACIKHVK